MKIYPVALALLPALLPLPGWSQSASPIEGSGTESTPLLGTVTVRSGHPSSLPMQIPTTIEGISGQQIAQTINATDSEDALKYLPSLLVRKRYVGDYNHAVLSTRASGTGNSARSLVYADGILLSNLLGNGAGFTPRWGLVTPEEIERVDVLYGPFSAAYSGNSVGAVVDYQTRMPDQFEAHIKLNLTVQPFDLYATHETARARQLSASIGNRQGGWAWWLNVNRLDSIGQPLVFATRNLSDGVAPTAGSSVVSGAVAGLNNKNQPWWILGTSTNYHSIQDHAKFKLSYDITPGLRASYTLGWWQNGASSGYDSYLRNSQGQAVTGGNVLIDGRQYNLNSPSLAFVPTQNQLEHLMQAITLKSHGKNEWDYEISASGYDYRKDISRNPSLSSALEAGPGRITDQNGTGWNNLSLRTSWRPGSASGKAGHGKASQHLLELGYQLEHYHARTLVSATPDWKNGSPASRFSAFNGNTALSSWFAQDTWRFAPEWKSTLGLRSEHWQAYGGQLGNAAAIVPFGATRSERYFSPKAALSWQVTPDWSLKASGGRSVRFPTAGELYQGSINGDAIVNTDPNLRPERSWTSEFSAEHSMDNGSACITLFAERTHDALYSQPLTNTVSTVQNIDAIHTHGLELVWQNSDIGKDLGIQGMSLTSSLTYTESIIRANRANPASVGKNQPRVPQWRANAVASYKPDAKWAYTLAARYSGKQYGQLDNSDINGNSYLGFSSFFVADARITYQINRQWRSAFGVDNLNNQRYWAFHPYPQRSWTAELQADW
jgi:iron complex outermembrane recepter protein